MGLGGEGVGSSLIRWAFAALVAMGAKKYIDTGKASFLK